MRYGYSCPISGSKVDQRVVRATSLLSALLLGVSLVCDWWWLAAFLAGDFLVRAYSGREALLSVIARVGVRLFGSHACWEDRAPKKFAASLGAAGSLAIALLLAAHLQGAALVVAAILGGCMLLEGIFGLCVGCAIYRWINVSVPFQFAPERH
ncbi:MAG: DUF4395 domain-containing protein [Campylobacterales bacterium]